MFFPKLRRTRQSLQTLDVFGGYNRSDRINEGEFSDMQNLTSDHYPRLSPRLPRGSMAAAGPAGKLGTMVGNMGLCYVKGSCFVLPDGKTVDMGLADGEKQLVSMGAYVIILPDKKWVNVAAALESVTESAYGQIECSCREDSFSFQVCKKSGEPIAFSASDCRPENPEDGAFWVDTTAEPPVLKKWYAAAGIWMEEASYLRITLRRTDNCFSEGDALRGDAVTGVYTTPSGTYHAYIPENPVVEAVIYGDTPTVYDIVVRGVAEFGTVDSCAFARGTYSWSRAMPDMDFVIESGNRLWGCKYGMTENGFVNEIYASALGDFKNWQSFQGISTDSYWASVGTGGTFTGAVNYLGSPLFFKENSMIRISGDRPENFRLRDMPCQGVREGCHKSLAIVDNVLYYKSPTGICAYDGSLPVDIGRALGSGNWENGVAAGFRQKYYISMEQAGRWALLVYDTARGLWHREDDLQAVQLQTWDNRLYCLTPEGDRFVILGGGDDPEEPPVSWMAQTGPMGMFTCDAKYISRLALRISLEPGSRLMVFVRYDHAPRWEHICTLKGSHLRSFTLPIRPKRCDHMQLRLEGVGMAKIYSLTKVWEEGSDVV